MGVLNYSQRKNSPDWIKLNQQLNHSCTWFQLQYCASIVQRQLVGFLWVGGVVYSHLDLIRRCPHHPCFGRLTIKCCNQDFHMLGWKFEVKYYFQHSFGHFFVGVGDFGDHVHGFITSSFTRITKLCQYILQTCPPCFSESWARLYLILGSLDVDSTRQKIIAQKLVLCHILFHLVRWDYTRNL